ncbi:hypothetical protein GA0061083_2848 [Pseudarthrobacter enclensis]|uniref:hypothetical protein n=1 Tax=Pseudarthrobacter enclensis TaxID=993070 RepID=UPI000815D00D|nr:hypothetical protein [Pseudarthrobacter enclensis]SCC13597.1 hypothetical protein GA0061083_2848 [Pseudarthrobacter enclensis]
MTGNGEKAFKLLRDSGTKVKASGTKLYSLAKDPAVQAKAKQLAEDGQKLYRLATSPEAKRAYKQAAAVLKKTRRK